MRTLIIESTPTVLRWAVESHRASSREVIVSHQLVGLKHTSSDDWIWSEGDQQITAFEDIRVTVRDIWNRIISKSSLPDRHKDASLLISSFCAAITLDKPVDSIVMMVPEGIPESSQNSLVSELSSRFRVSQSETFLLWRSVAIALCPDATPPGNADRRIICDFGHAQAEATLLETSYKSGCYCPVRDFTRDKGRGLNCEDATASWLAANYRGDLTQQALGGNFFGAETAYHLERDQNFDVPDAWLRSGLRYHPIKPAHEDWAKPADLADVTGGIAQFIEHTDLSANERILWHGWPVYWHGEDQIKRRFSSSCLMEPASALLGGAEFARRRRLKLPTYFELLPGYEIRCQHVTLGLPRKWEWATTIKGRKLEGTKTAKAPPNKDFSLLAGTKDFSLNVRVAGQDKYRFIKTELPVSIDENEPILIKSEVRPTGGSVKISIAPRENPNLFGQKAEVALQWDSAEERDVKDLEDEQLKEKYAYPFIIQSEGDSWKRGEIEFIVRQVASGRNIDSFGVLHDLMKQGRNPYTETYVDAFGNLPAAPGLSEEWEQFVAELNDYALYQMGLRDSMVDRKWIGTAGRLFHYASEEFREQVFKQAFSREFTRSGGSLSAMYRWALGRTCRNPKHLEAYINKGLREWRSIAGMEFWLFWPFCKALSYYGENAKISREAAFGVFVCGEEMLKDFIDGTVPDSGTLRKNWLKWILSAILFGLRVREIYPDFLPLKADAGSALEEERKITTKLQRHLKNDVIYYERIPPASLAGITIPQGRVPTLPELVLRFLEARADETDVAIAGGIGLTS